MLLVSDAERIALLARLMEQSYRVSIFAPPMKPFIRFMPGAADDIARCYWDFDDRLQARLWMLGREIASPHLIEAAAVTRWGENLQALCDKRRRQLQRAQDQGIKDVSEWRGAHIDFAIRYLRPGARLMFVGAGTGPACFQLARHGIHTVGIDPLIDLLIVAREWADYFQLPAQFVGMDVARLAFKPHSFDSFYLGIYGYLPTAEQNRALRLALARLIVPGGIAFVTGIRKKYTSYWYKMGHPYPPRLVEWLMPQTDLDFHYADPDGPADRLRFGLYHGSHSVESLPVELSDVFEVIECRYDPDDGRYLTVVVRPHADLPDAPPLADLSWPEPDVSPDRWRDIQAEVGQIEAVCDELADHAKRIVFYFRDPAFQSAGEAFRRFSPQIAPFVDGLRNLIENN